MAKLPSVVIVGRTNVGKSTLFNRLSTKIKSLTLNKEGVTRDFLRDTITWRGHTFDLVDTGGVSLKKCNDPIAQRIKDDALQLMNDATIILMVCDGTIGVTQEDRLIASLVHKLNKPALLVINKIDTNLAKERHYECERLGFKEMFPVSAQHGLGIAELLEQITDWFPRQVEVADKDLKCRVVLLGKPNVGKSSLMNLLLKKDRSMVADQPGTTREAISERVSFYQEDIELTDTPGVRRCRSVEDTLETMMVQSSLQAVERADIIILVVDASYRAISNQELKLAFYAFERKYKGLIILFNKQDLVDEYTKVLLDMSQVEYEHLLKKVVTINTSCKTEQNIGKLLSVIDTVWKRYSRKFTDEELDMLFKEALLHKPLFHNGMGLVIRKVKQVAQAPITIALIVNKAEWFGKSQLNFFDNLMRRTYDLDGAPIRFVLRNYRQ